MICAVHESTTEARCQSMLSCRTSLTFEDLLARVRFNSREGSWILRIELEIGDVRYTVPVHRTEVIEPLHAVCEI
jgi:hypothetical protein